MELDHHKDKHQIMCQRLQLFHLKIKSNKDIKNKSLEAFRSLILQEDKIKPIKETSIMSIYSII
jgi:hypothetical protein